jgi:N-acetylglutamate synthase-like GNAT family acetyltransferase
VADPAAPPFIVDRMAVRPARPDDAEVVYHILATAPVPREATLEQLRQQFEQPPLDDGRGQWVVEVAGGVVGWMSLRSPQDDAGGLEVSIYLEPGLTGQGRACRLVEEFLIRVARNGGAEFLTATPDTPQAESFLERCGFHRLRVEDGDDPIAAKLDAGFGGGNIWDRQI